MDKINAHHRPLDFDPDEDREVDDVTLVANLIGWSSRPTVQRTTEQGQAREILATALGVDAEQLLGLDEDALNTALGRLRSLVNQCERLASEAAIDDLTGAFRRGPGLSILQHEIDRARRNPDHRLAVLFLDVDGLKRVNDTRGHAAGDELLVNVVRVVRDRLRSYDLVVRYGGDEFICGLSGVGREEADHLTASIQSQIAERAGGAVSIGVAVLGDGDDAVALVGRADADLYSRRAARRR
jgi:diguanylate cyclase (GGDEF)-like protein